MLPSRKQYNKEKEKYVVSKVIFEDPVGLNWGRKIFSHHVSTLEGLELTKGGSLKKIICSLTHIVTPESI